MKKFLQQIVNNGAEDKHSSVVGTIAGLPDLINGIITHNCVEVIRGLGIIFLGLITKSN
jgi:hypothetical protein